MDNPLIANCPEDPTLAAAYAKGIRGGMNLATNFSRYVDELERHVLHLMQDKKESP